MYGFIPGFVCGLFTYATLQAGWLDPKVFAGVVVLVLVLIVIAAVIGPIH